MAMAVMSILEGKSKGKKVSKCGGEEEKTMTKKTRRVNEDKASRKIHSETELELRPIQ